ncbi:fucose mutarotase-like [Daphnia carinata]|uniref:fucose mutarotase-like n=1 Tax=Daphnia carinata TaxID=120202 RepID=UPI00257F9483|nr:fucose mutarotase-like [Daphnia carinata]
MGRLKGISPLLSPDLLHTLCSMGHGDELVLADANFPTASMCNEGAKQIRADGHSIPALLEAILALMPLDTYCWSPASVMDMTDTDRCKGLPEPPLWPEYKRLMKEAEKRDIPLQTMERFDFYGRARKAFAIVQTGETALYGNIILKMGVIAEPTTVQTVPPRAATTENS